MKYKLEQNPTTVSSHMTLKKKKKRRRSGSGSSRTNTQLIRNKRRRRRLNNYLPTVVISQPVPILFQCCQPQLVSHAPWEQTRNYACLEISLRRLTEVDLYYYYYYYHAYIIITMIFTYYYYHDFYILLLQP
jgi:hypothetical protein